VGKNNVSRSEAVRDLIAEYLISAPEPKSKALKVAVRSEITKLLAPKGKR
jgi:metal-responsive CopG/Arc/MetJ family transcriptional regulator